MNAILLAAGVGARLAPFTDEHPKCLIKVGGKSLLDRHLDILCELVDGITLVVGYRHGQIRDAVGSWKTRTGHPIPVECVQNDDFERGSVLSLYAAHQVLVADDTVVMDADVLYGPVLMKRLLESPHANCFLLDDSADDSGEEMMVCVKDGRALHIARSHDPSTQSGWDLTGEGVGFFKLDRSDAAGLVAILDEMIAAGICDVEYEDGLARFMAGGSCGYETVGDLPWTEIDFPEDVDKARVEILPLLR
jgi:choline kinase